MLCLVDKHQHLETETQREGERERGNQFVYVILQGKKKTLLCMDRLEGPLERTAGIEGAGFVVVCLFFFVLSG